MKMKLIILNPMINLMLKMKLIKTPPSENNGFKEVFITMTDMVSDHVMKEPICDYS